MLLTAVWVACQSNVVSEFSAEPGNLAYNDDAPRTTIAYCTTAACDNLFNEERYQYNAAGILTRIEYWHQGSSGKMEQSAYVEHLYNAAGQLARKIRYGNSGAGWVAYDESEFDYANGVLKTERTYFNRRNPDVKVLTGSVSFEYKEGQKVGQKWYDDSNKLYRQAAFEYKNKVLTRETWYGEKENVIRVFEHTFAGNRRQIGEYLPTSKELISMMEKMYDAQGRLVTQETKVNNPLLCAMTAGVVRYSY